MHDDEFAEFLEMEATDIRAEREEDERRELQELIEAGERLSLEDCSNPMFDRQRPVYRRIHSRGVQELAYEWVTVTDQFVQVGCTYCVSDGELSIVDKQNRQLFLKVVKTPEQFAKAMKAADRKHRKLEDKA